MKPSISLEQMEWMNSLPIRHYLPYTFDNGLEFEGFNAHCSGCEQGIEPNDLRGSLSLLNENRCLLTAKGFCEHCNGITCFNFILTADEHLHAEAVDMDVGGSVN
ncbi:MAG: hypothetical protein OQJ89_06260 [Kangiellaceae bacterium]|nr:hypothetical protein [Kangiellaceae bacterium]MCW9016545.1 hypothetical protein [Kangiellaceae bacterium]